MQSPVSSTLVCLVIALAGCGDGAGPTPNNCPGGVCVRGSAPDLGLVSVGGGTPDLGGDLGGDCTEGADCVIDNCSAGKVTCGPFPHCALTGNVSDGTLCPGGACMGGSCIACSAGATCITSDGCHRGSTTCTNGVASCAPLYNAPDGTSCGANMVCSAGSCVACQAGASCVYGPCFGGVISCATGAPVCMLSAELPDGTGCGSGNVCYEGQCLSCGANAACATATCAAGTVSCASGLPECTPTSGTAGNGTSCGNAKVCYQGMCDGCLAGQTCTPSDACKTGTTSCASGQTACVDSGNAGDGTSCGTNKVCKAGSCVGCVAGVACTPANVCHLGVTSCTTGAQVCTDTGNAITDGTDCGGGKYCHGGACNTCTPGAACSTGDPCQTGVISCANGSAVCVAQGSTGVTNCGGTGTCGTNGHCACTAGSGFYDGACQACPAGASTGAVVVRVNADPTVGLDNQCCGRLATAGFGGPCRTIGYAAALAAETPGATVLVTGDWQGNASHEETYPITLDDISLSSGGNYAAVCIPGAAGQDVLHVSGQSRLNGLAIGEDCAGKGYGGKDGIYVGDSSGILPVGVFVGGVVNGLHLDGGMASYSGDGFTASGDITITNVSGDGILCRSDTTPTAYSSIDLLSVTVANAKQHDIFAGHNCSMGFDVKPGANPTIRFPATLNLGAGVCATPKGDTYGLWVEDNAFFSLQDGTVFISCTSNNAVTVHDNGSGRVPLVLLVGGTSTQSSIRHAGCSGLYAEAGTLGAGGLTLRDNHWGVTQRSTVSGTTAIIDLDSPGYPNTFACNKSSEPGDCCTGASCPVGGDIFNNSGLPLDAKYNVWTDSPIPTCTCNSALSSCTCTTGATTPPDGIDVLNAPLTAGTPTTDVSSFTQTTSITCAP